MQKKMISESVSWRSISDAIARINLLTRYSSSVFVRKRHLGLCGFILFAVFPLILLAATCGWEAAHAQSQLAPPVPLGVNFLISDSNARGVEIQGKPAIDSDGTNFFVVWRDSRDFATNGYDIYGARITPDGTVLDPNGIPISTFPNYDPNPGNQYIPSVAFDGTNYFVVWNANRHPTSIHYEVYASRVTPTGAVLDPGGLQLTSGANSLRMASIAFDGTNYLITWRNSFNQIRGIRASTSGANLDDLTGLSIGTGFYPYVAFDGIGYLVVWHTWGNGLDIRGAKVSKEGTVIGSIPICTASADQDGAAIAFDGANYFVVWNDRRGGNDHNDGGAYGTRVSPDGTVLDSPALKIGEYAWSGTAIGVTFDGTDYLVIWHMDNYLPYFRLADVYGRRVSKNGIVLDKKGVPISTSYGHQFGPVVGFNANRYLIAWGESLSSGRCYEGCIYGQVLQKQTTTQPNSPPVVPNKAIGGWTSDVSPTSQGIYELWAFDESRVYALGEDGVFSYDGNDWIFETKFPQGRQYGVWGIRPDNLWTAGNCWAVFNYNGQSWNTSTNCWDWPDSPHGLGVWGTDNTNILTVGVDGRFILYDGLNWIEKSTGVSVDLSDVWGVPYSNVYAVGEFGTIIRYDRKEWSRETNVPTVQRLNGIWGSSKNNIFVVGDFGTILHYDGVSWNSQESGTTEHLYGVWGADKSHVYVVGHKGTILGYDGNEWNDETSGTSRDLFALGGAGNYLWAAGDYGVILKKTLPILPIPWIPLLLLDD